MHKKRTPISRSRFHLDTQYTAYRVCGILPGEEQYSFTLLFEERSAQISPRAADSESVALVYSVISKLRSTLSKRTIGTPGRAKRLLTAGRCIAPPEFKSRCTKKELLFLGVLGAPPRVS